MTSKTPSKGYSEAWLVESRSDITKKYTVSRRPDGTFACDCPAWKFAHAPKPACKHIQGVREILDPAATAVTVQAIREAQVRRRERVEMVKVTFDDQYIGRITQDQAEQFKATMRAADFVDAVAKPPQTVGDFTIRRKFRL